MREEVNAKPRSQHPIRQFAQKAVWKHAILIGTASLFLLGGCKNKQPANSAASQSASSAGTASGAPGQSAPSTDQANQANQPNQANQANQANPPNSSPAPAAAAPSAAPSPAGPAMTATASPPPPPPPPVYVVPSGTHLTTRISQTISAKNNNVGDTFRGTLVRPVRVGSVTVLRSGTPVAGTVVAAKGQGRFKGAGDLGIALSSVGPESVTTTAYEKTANSKGKRSAGIIGGGGGGGALIGALAGGGKGALIGGLVGAGAGTAGAAFTGNTNVEIPAESVVTFTLTSPIRIVGKPGAPASPQQQ